MFKLVESGELEIEVSDGEVRRFGPGSLILGEDTSGRVHRTRVLGRGACFAMVMLPAAWPVGSLGVGLDRGVRV